MVGRAEDQLAARVKSMIQFFSPVLPSSGENSCSQRGVRAVTGPREPHNDWPAVENIAGGEDAAITLPGAHHRWVEHDAPVVDPV